AVGLSRPYRAGRRWSRLRSWLSREASSGEGPARSSRRLRARAASTCRQARSGCPSRAWARASPWGGGSRLAPATGRWPGGGGGAPAAVVAGQGRLAAAQGLPVPALLVEAASHVGVALGGMGVLLA